jgi:hypothetical protein
MNPLDMPSEITALADTCPLYLKPATVPTVLAHFWPAIEAHIREQVAQEIEKSEFRRGVIAGSGHYVGGYIDGLNDAAAVARGTHT